MADPLRIFSGRPGRPMSEIELVEASVSPEEIRRRRAELRKRELIDAGRKGFAICMPSDFDETCSPWLVKIADQTVWKAEAGSPPDGFRPDTHCVVVNDGGSWYYLTAAAATGMPNAPRSVAELRERREASERKAAEHEKQQAAAFKAKQASAVPVTLAMLDQLAPPTLRAAVETVERSGGKVEVKGGRVVVFLPPGEVGVAPWVGGEQAGGRAAKILYLAEAELVASRRGDGPISAEKVPAEPLLPSGRLAR